MGMGLGMGAWLGEVMFVLNFMNRVTKGLTGYKGRYLDVRVVGEKGCKYAKNSQDSRDFMKGLIEGVYDGLTEVAAVMYMNNAANVIGSRVLSTGGMSGTIIDPRVVLGVGLAIGAVRMVICHVHPSGVLKPSEEDIRITNRVKEGGKIVDIELLDHLILDGNDLTRYYSFADEGLL
jgi:DNA repair protein RadC